MRLVTFGDSWTAGHGVETDLRYKREPFPPEFILRQRYSNSWVRWVANKLDCEFINLGVCGYGNEFISLDLERSFDNGFINDDDIIIVMFSYPYRYSGDTRGIQKIFIDLEERLKNNKHFYFNSFFPSFKEEDFDTSKLPYYFINPDGCVSDVLKDYEIKNDVGVWEYGCRSVWNQEKQFWEGVYHPNLLGYRLIADYIYEQIKDVI